ncbi:MAG TPA: DUF3536 domain-containing protein [Acidimicrobiales bacterium]|jgi:hypothetical protein|nr:DUF3536 domain-containing protein [Acidimicrobiales bacterium]
MGGDRNLIVHGHFYQPPRENPWTEEVPREPSAAPFHDWNARIDAESYRANAAARIVDGQNRVVSVVNNYAHISYDIGPTLMAWLEAHAPDTYASVLDGDREGGGAMAQSYFHVILPLCTERDLRTNIRWGLADFRHRFGRDAEGVWLPETAVDPTVLRVLREEGVRFTILAPTQAAAVAHVDTRRTYRSEGVEIVFFDGPLSHAAAFEAPSSQALVDRALATLDGRDGVVCLATDGETFGHHHQYFDRGLAYALTVEGPRRGLTITNAAAYLRAHPPTPDDHIEVRTSAWSCAHGVDRWADDCGCVTGGEPGWNQRWRRPLRDALDLLRDRAVEVFERRGASVFADGDPWAARDAYVDVLLGRVSRDDFAARWTVDGADPVEALTLLESQRHALAMYTSCGWFFNDLAGIETVYVLRLAARCMDLLRELGEDAGEDAVLDVLSNARSNVPAEGDGRQVWSRHVVPARVDGRRVVAHLALVELLQRPLPTGRIAGFDVEWVDHAHDHRGHVGLCTGNVLLVHARTGRRTEYVYAGLHLGGLEVLGAVRAADPARDEPAIAGITKAFGDGAPLTTLLRLLGDGFAGDEFDLSWALPDAADQILASVADSLAERMAAAYQRLFDDHRATLDALAIAGYDLPPELRAPAVLALSRRFESEVAAQAGSSDPQAYEEARQLVRVARRHGVHLDTPRARAVMSRSIRIAVERAVEAGNGGGPEAVDAALQLLLLARDLELYPDVDVAQELVYDALVERPTPSLRLLGTALGLAVETLGDPR